MSSESLCTCWPFGLAGILVGVAVGGLGVGIGASVAHRLLGAIDELSTSMRTTEPQPYGSGHGFE